jgi:hypothetical protein
METAMTARRAGRRVLIAGLLAAGAAGAGMFGAIAVTLLAHGVFTTTAPAWTVPVRAAGADIDVNVPGRLRRAIAPTTARLRAGRSVATRAGRIRFEREGDALVATCAPCRLQHPRLASEPLLLPELVVSAARHGSTVAGHLASGAVRIDYEAQLSADRVRLRWTLPRTEAGEALRVLASIVPEARWGRIEGAVEASGTLMLPELSAATQLHVDALAVADLGTAALGDGEFTLGCRQADGTVRRVALGTAGQWLSLERVGAYLPAAVIAAEDQRFRQHDGYDGDEVASLLAAMSADGPARGASTITQQVARTLFTGGERTAARKLRELLYAVEMESTLGKTRILELYLNTVDWGPGLCGARAAARAYFGKPPARLTALEAAWLAGILRAPHAAHTQQLLSGTPDRARAEWVLMQMRDFPRRDRLRWANEPLVLRPPAVQGRPPVARPTAMAIAAPQLSK